MSAADPDLTTTFFRLNSTACPFCNDGHLSELVISAQCTITLFSGTTPSTSGWMKPNPRLLSKWTTSPECRSVSSTATPESWSPGFSVPPTSFVAPFLTGLSTFPAGRLAAPTPRPAALPPLPTPLPALLPVAFQLVAAGAGLFANLTGCFMTGARPLPVKAARTAPWPGCAAARAMPLPDPLVTAGRVFRESFAAPPLT
mmetsp:Transcript_51437/g.116938  ORF Transcript_51437/g.116938 Transcript_51437/m.116938 type:complete len:200 (-) Transcript_51437:89-688(-)